MPLFSYLIPKPRGVKRLLNLLLKESTEGFAGIIPPGRSFQIEVQRRTKLFLKYSVLDVSPLANWTKLCAFTSALLVEQRGKQCVRELV